MVMITLRRGEADTPSIKTPAWMRVTDAGVDAFCWAQVVEMSHNRLSRTVGGMRERFTATSRKAGLYSSRRSLPGKISGGGHAGERWEKRAIRRTKPGGGGGGAIC